MPQAKVYTAPPDAGEAVLGKSLPALLWEACQAYTNPHFLNQDRGGEWETFSLEAFRRHAEDTALGFMALGLERGEHVAFYMNSDAYFCIADMGCLVAGLIDVPIYLSQSPDIIRYILEHSEARVLCVSTTSLLQKVADILKDTPLIKTVVVMEPDQEADTGILPGVRLLSLEEVQREGREQRAEDPEVVTRLLDRIDPHDLATVIYTSGTTGLPKGVMLSHQNISYNVLTAFSSFPKLRPGPDGEVAISFLPLTHVFARTLYYGFVALGMSVFFTTPPNLIRDLARVRPTIFATVPRVLEKVYSRIEERIEGMEGLSGTLGRWALQQAYAFELGQETTFLDEVRRKVADLFVYKRWRAALGGRAEYIICGGAALNAKLANLFGAAGIPIYQGYGLTETSPVLTHNRPGGNRAGAVGQVMKGTEIMIAEDGEILARGPQVMMGYYKDEAKTRDAIDEDGWFHTGDIGEFTVEGYLRITDRKKDLFKLSTGKYVMPQPLENRLATEALVEHAVVVGAGHQYCTALIFPDQAALQAYVQAQGWTRGHSIERLLQEKKVQAYYQRLVEKANRGMDHWSTIKRFALIPEVLSIDNGLLTPTLKVKRSVVQSTYQEEIDCLYSDAELPRGVLLNVEEEPVH